MSETALVVSTVKSFAAPSAVIAEATSALEAFGVPAVPVKTSTFPAFAIAGAVPRTANAVTPSNVAVHARQARVKVRPDKRNLIRDSSSEHTMPSQPTSRGDITGPT